MNFRFQIRDLVWATTVAALGVALVIKSRESSTRQVQLVKATTAVEFMQGLLYTKDKLHEAEILKLNRQIDELRRGLENGK